jgi:DNA polymerase III epsilon subunit-like protein
MVRKICSDKKKLTLAQLVFDFASNLKSYLKNSDVRTYLKIFCSENEIQNYIEGTNLSLMEKLYDVDKSNFLILREIYALKILGAKSKIDFLKDYSEEQFKYITNLDMTDSKLIACAGSGKTRSIIGRMRFLVSHGFATKDEIFMITFSKDAANDFQRKVESMYPDYETYFKLKNFSTIDSMAKSILCKVRAHKSDNVETLSIALRNYLMELVNMVSKSEVSTSGKSEILHETDSYKITSFHEVSTSGKSEIEALRKIKNIKYLFVDEAQDLNEVQYDIICCLKKLLGTICELVGDPNQNIYQFRRSDSEFLVNFDAKVYELTLNFRSSEEIIEYCEKIKPIQTSQSKSAKGLHGPKVITISKSSADLRKLILLWLRTYSKKPNHNLSDVAIICPTRGIKSFDSIGLSVFFNYLKLNGIPVRQLYDESGLNDERKRKVGREEGAVNLLTYHGTKGLEFDVVFVMDFYHKLFNINPDESEHKINQFLTYVACSRAKRYMFVCTYTDMHGGCLNHWITKIPRPMYFIDSNPIIPKLEYRQDMSKPEINGITELLGELPDTYLDKIHDMLKITYIGTDGNDIVEDDSGNNTKKTNPYTRKMYEDFSNIDRCGDETLFGIFCEQLLYLQHNLSKKLNPIDRPLIKHILERQLVKIEDNQTCKLLKKYIYNKGLSWKKFDAVKHTMPEHIVKLIESTFSRNLDLTEYVVCGNEFVEVIDLNSNSIRKAYTKYINPQSYNYDYKEILEDFFYLIVVEYAYNINHYHHICDKGREKTDLLLNGKNMFEAMNNFFKEDFKDKTLDIDLKVIYHNLDLMGAIDFVEKSKDKDETIVEVKCVKEISIKYYLQLFLYNFCYYYQKSSKRSLLYKNKFKIINLLTGLEHRFRIEIQPSEMMNFLIKIAEIGSLSFDKMNLVYDLETTDRITKCGPFDQKPSQATNPRSIYYYDQVQKKYFGRTYPEIIEIAIKDYDTGLVLIDTLVCPYGDIHPEVIRLTGIHKENLKFKPKLDLIRAVLEKKMASFKRCTMMAHNGSSFDNPIMLHYKLVDPTKVNFLDTLSLIPIHIPSANQLKSKSLGDIYKQLFGKTFDAHRAMNDVDALIKIMLALKIKI